MEGPKHLDFPLLFRRQVGWFLSPPDWMPVTTPPTSVFEKLRTHSRGDRGHGNGQQPIIGRLEGMEVRRLEANGDRAGEAFSAMRACSRSPGCEPGHVPLWVARRAATDILSPSDSGHRHYTLEARDNSYLGTM